MNRLLIILMLIALTFVSFRVWGVMQVERYSPPTNNLPIHPRGLQMPEIGMGAWTPGNNTGTPETYPSSTVKNNLCYRFGNGDMICQ